jgi:hypothetical protein
MPIKRASCNACCASVAAFNWSDDMDDVSDPVKAWTDQERWFAGYQSRQREQLATAISLLRAIKIQNDARSFGLPDYLISGIERVLAEDTRLFTELVYPERRTAPDPVKPTMASVTAWEQSL